MATPRKRVTDASVVQADEPLHVKYRPQKLTEVIGQRDVVKSLTSVLRADTRPHAYIFSGPSGTGKTTLARILAKEFNCAPANIIEADAATNNGIDAMRDLTATLRYQGFGDAPNKTIVLDEAHALSKAAWQSLLKSVEEPPPHVFFCFCTTEEGKIPEAIRTRCTSYNLKAVRYDDMMDLLEDVVGREKLDVPESFLKQIAKASNGSPRQALVMLAMVRGCEDDDEVARLLEAPLENTEIIDLCRALLKNSLTWPDVCKTLKALDMPAESVRIVITNYIAACLINARTEKEAGRLLDVLGVFAKPYNSSDKLAPLLLSFGALLIPT